MKTLRRTVYQQPRLCLLWVRFSYFTQDALFLKKSNDIPSVFKWALSCFLYLNVYFVKANITCTFKTQCLGVLINASFWCEIKTTIRSLTRRVKTISTCKNLAVWLPDYLTHQETVFVHPTGQAKPFDALVPGEPLNTVQSIYKKTNFHIYFQMDSYSYSYYKRKKKNQPTTFKYIWFSFCSHPW